MRSKSPPRSHPMAPRLILTDDMWVRIETVRAEIRPRVGRPSILGDRMFGEAVLYPTRAGSPGRDLPADCGQWDTGYPRVRTGERPGLGAAWGRRVPPVSGAAELWAARYVDSTIRRAHPHAAGAAQQGAVRQPQPSGAPGAVAPPSGTPSAWRTRPASGSPGPAGSGRTGRGARPWGRRPSPGCRRPQRSGIGRRTAPPSGTRGRPRRWRP